MTSNTKLDEKLEGAQSFRAWKYRVTLILQENALENFVKELVVELEEDETKTKFRKNMIRAKRIITNSIKNHLIPHVSSLKTPK